MFPGLSCIIDFAVTDLPDPDSPTIPKTSPSFKESDKLLTANIRPSSVSNSTFKFLISNKFVI